MTDEIAVRVLKAVIAFAVIGLACYAAVHGAGTQEAIDEAWEAETDDEWIGAA